MSLIVGTWVSFRETLTRRTLQGTVTECGDGEVKIATPDGRIHTRVPSRVVPMRAKMTASDIKARFKYLRQVVAMVAHNHTVSAIISGPGGVGKTHTVTETLDSHGYHHPLMASRLADSALSSTGSLYHYIAAMLAVPPKPTKIAEWHFPQIHTPIWRVIVSFRRPIPPRR